MSKEYNDNSISVLKNIDAIKKRPGMYIGSTDSIGYHHMMWEILDNSIDEFLSGNCSKIEVEVTEDEIVKIRDYGRGIPTGTHKTEGIPTIDVVFTITHAGGKFDKDSYAFSGGLHGVGATVVNALSPWLEVKVWQKNKCYSRRYENGIPTQKELTITDDKQSNGTLVCFSPDQKVFKKCHFDKDVIAHRLRDLAFLNKGLEITFKWQNEERISFKSNDGLNDFVNYLIKGKNKIHESILFNKTFEQSELEFCFVYDDKYDASICSFVNNVNTTDGGTHLNAVLDSMSKVILQYAVSLRLIGDTKVELNKSDICEGLNLIVRTMVREPEFAGQTKNKLNNQEERQIWGDWIFETLDIFFKKNKDIAKVIVTKIVDAYKSRELAKKTKAIAKGTKSSVLLLPGKLTDCSSKNYDMNELFICEGDSAAGSLKQARNRTFQAVLPLKGKILNVGKSSFAKMLENDEVKAIITAIGVKITNREVFTDNIRYGKIIISADEDVDGKHITCLLMTLFYKFMRKIIEEGRLFICDNPLYKVNCKNKSYYISNDEALEEFKEKHLKENLEITRFKGLGEMQPNQMYDTACNPETRKLKKVCIEDAIMANEMIEKLMGDDIVSRKEFLNANLIF